jgi:long-chain fatty acid transport protein
MQQKLGGTLGQRMNHYALVIALTLASAESSRAVGFMLPNQDPEAIGRGDAFTATADDPAAIYYNPAGITQLSGIQASVGLYAISAHTSYSSSSGSAHTDSNFQYVPQIYAVDTFTNVPISIGLGVYVPYGLGVNWGDNTPFNSVAEKGKLLYATANPVIAWKICKMLSVSAGPTINYSEATLQNEFIDFRGEDWAPGYTFGILFQPHPMVSIGLDYRSETSLDYSGKLKDFVGDSVYSTVKINFPRTALGGISFRPTPDWNLEFDLNWTQWSKIGTLTFQNTPFPFAGPLPVTLNYRDSFVYDFGVTRQLGKGYYASVGYIFSELSNPNANYNPVDPDANLHLGNFGFGHRGEHFDWAIAYQFAFNGGRTVTGDANAPADGTYKTFNNAVNASVTVKF